MAQHALLGGRWHPVVHDQQQGIATPQQEQGFIRRAGDSNLAEPGAAQPDRDLARFGHIRVEHNDGRCDPVVHRLHR
jgi:hypothetical protein